MNKTQAGTVGGAVLGGIVGAQFGKGGSHTAVAAMLGAVAGSAAGNYIGRHLDQKDIEEMSKSQQHALEFSQTGSAVSWKNPDSGASGYVTPTKTYVNHGRNCREYTHNVTIGGKTQSAFGKACRRDDGSWEIVQ